jgi:predicted anti-sigma-YlaC factor YlaD
MLVHRACAAAHQSRCGLLEASCTATSEALSDRLDDELQGLRRLRVGRHLGRCPGCRATLTALTRLVKTLRSAREVERDKGGSLVEDVLARIQEGGRIDYKRAAATAKRAAGAHPTGSTS